MTGDASQREQHAYRLLRRTSLVAGAFALLVAALLLWDFSQRRAKNPLEAPEFLALKTQLAKDPRSDDLKKQIRQLDLQLRERYFRQRHFAEFGGWILAGAALIALFSARSAGAMRRKLPMPQPQGAPLDFDEQTVRSSRWAIAGLAALLVMGSLALALGMRSALPEVGDKTPAAAATAAPRPSSGDFPSDADIARQWPRFRGPGGRGISACTDVPVQWNAGSGENICWKTAVPLPGNNSPVVWGDRVFLSGASEEKREVYAFDAASGKLLWQQEVPGTPQSSAKPPEISDDTGYAASTMTTDGRRVYAIFANGDLAAFDFAGKLAWSRSLGIPKSTYGHAASLAMHESLLLVPFDQGAEKDKLSKLLALDGATGKTVWEARRDVPCSWPSPIIIQINGKTQVITAANPWVIAYDAADGKEIWRAKCLRQDVGPSPTFADGIVYAVNEFPGLAAIRADGQGDVTQTHILWKGEEGLPDTASPLATQKYVFLLASSGTLTCYDAKAGKVLYQKDFEASFNSSPSLAGNRLYLFGREGKCWVVEPGQEGCKVVAESDLGEECVTSPAFQPGRFYIRGKANLFCVGKK